MLLGAQNAEALPRALSCKETKSQDSGWGGWGLEESWEQDSRLLSGPWRSLPKNKLLSWSFSEILE